MTARILVVDDDDTTREGLTELLRHAGYDPRPFGTFGEARAALATEPPDLLISDLRLDGFNGLQLVALSPQPVPAIIVTGFHDHVLEAEARRLGAEYLLKPVVPATLLALIEQRLATAATGTNTQESTRRWRRKPLTCALNALIENQAARLLDVSYGGVRFQTDPGLGTAIPRLVRLVLPSTPVAMELAIIWVSREVAGGWLCGAAVSNDTDPAWRRVVDGLA